MDAAAEAVVAGEGLPVAQQGPAWNLSDLYRAQDDPAIEADLLWAECEAKALASAFKGRMGEMSGDEVAAMLDRYEQLDDRLGRVSSFAQLRFAAQREDAEVGRFYQAIQERTNAIGTTILFVTLEI